MNHGRTPAGLKKLWRHWKVRLLFWTTLAGLLFGLAEFGAPVENVLHVARNKARERPASGQIVLVAVDDRTIDTLKQWPLQSAAYARLTDALHESGAKQIVFDIDLPRPGADSGYTELKKALASLGSNATLPVHSTVDKATGLRTDRFPDEDLRGRARIASRNVDYSWEGITWELPYSTRHGAARYPSVAAAMASIPAVTGTFPIDYAIDPRSVRVVSAADVINRAVSGEDLRGKDVVVATTSARFGDEYLMPGHGRMPGVYANILGAETLKDGAPLALGWLSLFLLSVALAMAGLRARSSRRSIAVFGAGVAFLMLAPIALEASGLYVQIMPAMFLLLIAGGLDAWRRFRAVYRERASRNTVSGLPNLTALRETAAANGKLLIAARVHNYAEICATLPADEERALVEQIASRLTLGQASTALFQGDEGIFIWLAGVEIDAELGGHLSALHTLFRSPVLVCGSRLDLSVTFGVEAVTDRSIANRIGGALVAADEAVAETLPWKRYNPADPEDAAWKLSLLSELDAAIEGGDLWVAYQPKFELGGRTIIGAEALVRWTHPQRGSISPMDFVPAAEQSGRIEQLTEFVLERAIRATAMLNRRHPGFNMSVNLSPKLLGRFPVEATVIGLLGEYCVAPECLTLEVTESVALATGAGELEPLHSLRARGVGISIDDYGTGLSTLDYMKRIPATEIKIDKSFVQGIRKNNSDKLMVNSTIQLAHSLNQKIVAEGIEDLETFQALCAMGCDVGQGFYLGKPLTFLDFARLMSAQPSGRRGTKGLMAC
jgi:EAL domain-containing protein (putative c-di-GMP-specific phosphodiesterase class I)/CHASE2 domain-containing sensor protein